jgi:hypothetical protein
VHEKSKNRQMAKISNVRNSRKLYNKDHSSKNYFNFSSLSFLSCQEDISFGIIDESVSDSFPDGDARVALTEIIYI